MEFSGPIPGESLTRELGNAPWEQPPEYAKVEEALAFYLKRLEDDEVMEEMLFVIEQDMPIESFVNTLLMYGEMQGKHIFDVSVLIGPVLHEYIKALCDAAQIKYREFEGKTSEEKREEKEKKTLEILMGRNEDDALPMSPEVGENDVRI